MGQVVESDAFRTVFDTALSNAHRVLVDRETGTIILNLTAAYDQIKSPLEQVAPKLADRSYRAESSWSSCSCIARS